MSYEAVGDDFGNHFISDTIKKVLKIPVLSINENLTVCEFTRLESLSLEMIVRQIRDEALYVFLGGFDSTMIELVDLDNQTWARVTLRTPVSEMKWVKISTEWPPGIENRKTALEGAPRPSLEVILRIQGHRYKWTAACASADGKKLATAYGKQGRVWINDIGDGAIEKLPALGAPIKQLFWGKEGTMLATDRSADHVHVFSGGAWRQVVLGTGRIVAAALSPCRNLLAVTTTNGGPVFVFDWSSLQEKSRFLAEPNATPKAAWLRKEGTHVLGVAWSSDTKRLFIGYAWPIVGVHDWQSGDFVYAVEGNLHFRKKMIIGPQNQLASYMVMADGRVYDDKGETLSKVPYPFGWGAFARDGRLLVTENEGLAKVWDIHTSTLIGRHSCAPDERIFVMGDRLVLRHRGDKELQVCSLPDIE